MEDERRAIGTRLGIHLVGNADAVELDAARIGIGPVGQVAREQGRIEARAEDAGPVDAGVDRRIAAFGHGIEG